MAIRALIFLGSLLFLMACSDNTHLHDTQLLSQNTEPVWYLQTNDENVKLFVKEYGDGETFIILHGGFGAEHSYLLDAFKGIEGSYRLVFYDQRGSLRSPAPAELISVDKHIEDIELLRQALGIDQINLVGHSMGTFLASSYLEKYPDHVKSMVLMALVYPRTPKTESEKELAKSQEQVFMEFYGRPEVENEIQKMGLDKEHLSSKEETNKWRITYAAGNIYDVAKWRQVKGGQVFYDQIAGSAAGKTLPAGGWDFFPIYENSNIPITVISGSHDMIDMGGKKYHKPLNNINNVEYNMIENAGHNVWVDEPGIFSTHLQKAMDKVAHKH